MSAKEAQEEVKMVVEGVYAAEGAYKLKEKYGDTLTYFGGIIVDYFIFGLNIKRRVCILSDKQEEIVRFILHDLHSGATLYDAIGAYNGEKRTEVVVIVDKQEYRLLMDYVKKTDPKAFVTVISVNEIRYQPKK